jgi:hypothetical protein
VGDDEIGGKLDELTAIEKLGNVGGELKGGGGLGKDAGGWDKFVDPFGGAYSGAKSALGGSQGFDAWAALGSVATALQPGQLPPRARGQLGQLGQLQLQMQRPGTMALGPLGPQLCRPAAVRRASGTKRKKAKRCACGH